MTPVRRVFISHASEFETFPQPKSFIDAAVAAVISAGSVPCDMGYFTARDEKPADYCQERVRACDVYIGVIGFRYGSLVRDRPDVSYTELEFEAASQAPSKPRLVFLLRGDASVPVGDFMDMEHGKRQLEFRKRLSDAGVTCADFGDAHELNKLIYQALMEDAARGGGLGRTTGRIDWPEGVSPYPGLDAFNDHYARLFFGRDLEISDVLSRMSEQGGRFLLISGASGSGKSSLIAAGLWRAVMEEQRLPLAGKPVWQRIVPGHGQATPFEPLVWGLLPHCPTITARPGDVVAELVLNKTTIAALVARHLPAGQELVLSVDQLEELFTRGFKDDEMRIFVEQLIGAVRDPGSRLRVVATIRSEFLARLEESEAALHALNAGYHYHLGPVSPRILREMIENPARATGYEFEPGLIDTLLKDAAQEPGNLPLAAYALKQLFERRRGRTFTHEAYTAIGGVAGAIGTKADQTMQTLDEPVRIAFDTVFAELVHLDRERPPTRKRAALSVFAGNDAANQLITALAGPECRIVVRGGEESAPMVEVAHEKLFSAWPKLKDWIDNGGHALRLIDYAEEAARRWEEMGGLLQELWRNDRAEAIQRALTRFNKEPSPLLERMLRPQQMLITWLDKEDLSHADRLLVGQKLAEFGDPRPGVGLTPDGLPDIEWVTIPDGRIRLEGIDHVFEVKPFRISKYPVTNAQFDAFINAVDGYRNYEWWRGIRRCEVPGEPRWKESNSPRETVPWFEAVAFCRWLSARTALSLRLPTEWEWQQAATGGDPTREYPWLGGWDGGRCNSVDARLNRTTPVGVYRAGATSQGGFDMAGNVWEWCLNTHGRPESLESMRTDDSNAVRGIRGGSWFNAPEKLRASYRNRYRAGKRISNIGFRLAQDIPQ